MNVWTSIPDVHESGCLLWIANKYLDGYGQIKIGGRTRQVHRVTWELENGPIPEGMKVLHTCDVRNCREIGHLKLGTTLDNNRDRAIKGRSNPHRGDSHPNSKLTPEMVKEIRKSTAPQDELAAKFGVAQSTVSKIKLRYRWSHVE